MSENSRPQGGDVTGMTKTDVSQGKPIDVANASFDPGYSLDTTLEAGYVKKDVLKRGYCDYGKSIGEGKEE
jgi:hypothetical protein